MMRKILKTGDETRSKQRITTISLTDYKCSACLERDEEGTFCGH